MFFRVSSGKTCACDRPATVSEVVEFKHKTGTMFARIYYYCDECFERVKSKDKPETIARIRKVLETHGLSSKILEV